MDDTTPASIASLRRSGFELFAASFLVLFQELALIRWLPGQVRVLAYFPNLILLSAFLGLGLGCLRSNRRSLLAVWPAFLLLLVTAGFAMSFVAFTQNSESEHLWLLYYDLPKNAPTFPDVRPPIVLAFILSALAFIPLGQIVAERLQFFQKQSSALWGYCLDILGSLTGVVVFSTLGFLGTFPVVWFSGLLIAGMLFFTRQLRTMGIYTAVAIATVMLVAHAERAQRYSPYYALSESREAGSSLIGILANGSLHQVALSLARGSEAESEYQFNARTGYHQPYGLLPRTPERVLVLGAGTGNDVAVALDEGVQHVDAVEIDPVILDLGRTVHPDHPYSSPRVRTINTDARSFLNESQDKYDLIVFGTLDSMTRLSALSNVRLDNFVYTEDCLKAARARLTSSGAIVMYFMVGTDYIDRRLAGMLYSVFDEPPMVLRADARLFNTIYMNGPALNGRFDKERATIADFFKRQPAPELPTDDWPYLYLQTHSISSFYLTLIGLFAALSIGAVFLASGDMRQGLAGGEVDVEMFCFGLAFLLLETKSVTAMNLAWGATWLTSAVVFGAILAMILLATVIVQLRPLPWNICIAGLVVALLLSYATPPHLLLRLNPFVKLLLSGLFVGTPIFFASACFALLFRSREHANLAFGWNLLGAVAGGLLEFLSMSIGIRQLALLALVAYLIAAMLRARREEHERLAQVPSTRAVTT
ncbi:MAG TPA: hypothetical protein VMT89_10095 [Candidatus Acidoferrales bacterium]|nr:hypothetical protein [Candidatus Acidoferrales bacterium]